MSIDDLLELSRAKKTFYSHVPRISYDKIYAELTMLTFNLDNQNNLLSITHKLINPYSIRKVIKYFRDNQINVKIKDKNTFIPD